MSNNIGVEKAAVDTSQAAASAVDIEEWIKGIPYEIAYWRSHYGNRKRRNALFGWSRYGKECVLEDFDMAGFMARQEDADPLILDVGCALSYAFGNLIDGKPANVRYIDPLAPFYNRILDRYKIDRPHIVYGMVEALSASFELGSVSFIHIRNALDHCYNPYEGVVQAMAILKVGGVLYLNHFVNEALSENYRGFHQFNICMENGHLVFWHPGLSMDVTEKLKAYADVTASLTPDGRVIAIIRKRMDMPSSFYDSRMLLHRYVDMFMGAVTYFHDGGHSLSYQVRRVVCHMGHGLMRLLPQSLLYRIKSVFAK